MSSTTQSHAYDSSVPDAINQAFDAVWQTLYAHVTPENDQADELKIALSQTLVSLASDGITDWQELRRKALESMALSFR